GVWGRVAGVECRALRREVGGGIAPRVVIATARTAGEDPCDCTPAPPRTPEPDDLGQFPERFSGDVGGRCVDFTVPNRVIDEVLYFKVVRVTEPEVEGTSGGPRRIGPAGFAQLAQLVGAAV